MKVRQILQFGGDSWEVDVFVNEHPVILECTTHVDADEMAKIEKFISLKKHLERHRSSPVRAIFCTYSFSRKIRKQCIEILSGAGVEIIDFKISI